MTTIFETERLRAVEIEPRHAPALFALFNHEANADSLFYTKDTLEEVEARIGGYKEEGAEHPRRGFRMVMEEKSGGAFVGFCHVVNKPPKTRPNIGYIVATEKTGQGYATEITGGLANLAFGHFADPSIEALSSSYNPASVIILTRNGFVIEDIKPDFAPHGSIDNKVPALVWRLDRPKQK